MTYSVEMTETFKKWLDKMKNPTAIAKVFVRIAQIEKGNFGDAKLIRPKLYEFRFDAGIRMYATIKNKTVVILLVGGDKANRKAQDADIAKAEKMIKAGV